MTVKSNTADREADGWTPRRNRKLGIYCSPRCGHGCTYDEFQEATRDAGKLAKRLGSGWSPVVWENMGWHYRVEKGCVALHPSVTGPRGHRHFHGYTVYFNSAHQFVTSATTPEAALDEACEKARAFARTLRRDATYVFR